MIIPLLISQKEEKIHGSFKKSIDLLQSSAQARGHSIGMFDSSRCKLLFDNKGTILLDGKKPKFHTLLVKPSFAGDRLDLTAMLIKQFEIIGVRAVNSYSSIVHTKNKIRQLQTLATNGIPIPRSMVVHSSVFTDDIVERLGSFPIIIKSVVGNQGVGVTMVESKRGMRALLDMMTKTDEDFGGPVIVQEYIRESSGRDIRVFVVGGKIIAAMDRVAKKQGEFRSNFSLGGKVAIAKLTTAEKRIALKTTKVTGLDFAGVDIIRSDKGPKVLEINANPGLKGITEATGIDVAGELIDYIVTLEKRALRRLM